MNDFMEILDKIESFVYGQGLGRYIILDYELSKSGDTLISRGGVTQYFVRQDLPESWKNFEVDW